MEEQASAPEEKPRSGLIDRWLATRTADDGDDVEVPTLADGPAAPPVPAIGRPTAPRSALSRLAERRAARGGQDRDVAAEILGALGTPSSPAPDGDATPQVDVAPRVDPARRVDAVPAVEDAPRAEVVALTEPAPSLAEPAPSAAEPAPGRLSLAGLRARRKEAGFDPLDTRIAGLEALVPERTDLDPAAQAPATDAPSPTEAQQAAAAARDAAQVAPRPADRLVPDTEPVAFPRTDPMAPEEAIPDAADSAALAVAGSVPERDERTQRLARMLRNRRGAEPQTPLDEPDTHSAAPEPAPAALRPSLPDVPAAPVPLAPASPPGDTAQEPPVLNFDAPAIPAGVDVFASLRDAVPARPRTHLDDPVDVLAPLRDGHGMAAAPGPTASAAGGETGSDSAPSGTTPDAPPASAPSSSAPGGPARGGGAHAAEPTADTTTDPASSATQESTPEPRPSTPARGGKRRAKVDSPPPNPGADDAIMALALEAVLRAEGKGAASEPVTTAATRPVEPGPAERPTAATQAPAPRRPTPVAAPAPATSGTAAAPRGERAEPRPDDERTGDLSRKHRPPERTGVVSGGVPALVEFAPQRSTQHLLAMFLFLSVVATISTGYLAYDSRGMTEIAIAAFCGVLTLILWSGHSTAAPARVKVEHGTLEVRSKDSHYRFDLTSPYTDLVATGTPGRRDWKVSIHRKSMPAFVIDSTLVDGREFMPVLEACRTEARRRATEGDRRRNGY